MVADFPLNKRSRREPGGLWDASNASAHITYHAFSRVLCCCSVAKLCPALSDTLDCSTPGSSILWSLCYWSLLQLMSIHEPVMLSHHPLSPLLPFAFSLSQHLVFSIEAALHIRWPKYWSFSISPSKEYSGLIPFRFDWFDLLEVQGTRKSLLQHHSSKASILHFSAFFMVQLSHPYMLLEKP